MEVTMNTVLLAGLLATCLVLVAADDYSKDFTLKTCKDEDGVTYPDGYSGPVVGKCQQRTCDNGKLTASGCGQVIDSNGNIVPETEGLPYPACCPSLNPSNNN